MLNDRAFPSHTPRRSYLLAFLTLLTALSSACSGCSDELANAGNAPTLEGAKERITLLEVGQSLAFDVTFNDANGEQVTDFQWSWVSQESPNYSLSHTLEAGVLHVEFTPSVPGKVLIEGRAEFPRRGDQADIVGALLADVRVWGGVPSHPLPAHERLTMVPGERRHTFAFPIAEAIGAEVFRTLGAGSITYAIDNANVATVNAQGLVEALAIGSATLVMSYGGKTQSIPITVAAGTVGPPPIGRSIMDDDWSYQLGDSWLRDSPNDRMRVAKNGWPVLAMVFKGDGESVPAGQLIIARWSGSGWGLELASRPYDVVEQPRLAIDENDTIWALYWSRFVRSKELVNDVSDNERAPVLAHRSLSAQQWSYDQFAHGLDRDQQRDISYGFGDTMTIQARKGGGAWAAFISQGERAPLEAYTRRCTDQLHLIEAREDTAATAHTVTLREHLLDDDKIGCTDLEATDPSNSDPMLEVLPLRDGEILPRVLSSHPWEADCEVSNYICQLPAYLFNYEGGKYARSNLLETFDFDTASDNNDFPYQNLALSRDLDSPFAEPSILIGLDTVDLLGSTHRTVVLRGASAYWLETAATSSTFGFKKGAYDFVSGGHLGTLRLMHPDGQTHSDPYLAELRLVDNLIDDAQLGAITAWAADPSHLYLFQAQESLVFYSMPVPQVMTDGPGADESVGVRVGSQQSTPGVHTAPLVLADGTRVVIAKAADGAPGLVMASTANGEPWTEVAITGTAAIDQSVDSIMAVDDTVFTVLANRLYSSSNYGVTWSTLGQSFVADEVWTIHPDGRFAGLERSGNNWTLYTDADLRNGFTPAVQDSVSFGAEVPGLVFGEDGSIYMTRYNAGAQRLEFVEFIDGVAQATVTIALPQGAVGIARPAHVTADGSLLASYVTSVASGDSFAPQHETLHIIRRDGTNNNVTSTELGTIADSQAARSTLGNDFVSIAIASLPNGDLSVGWTSIERTVLRRQAVLAKSSDDGKSWLAPVPIRPTGGAGQLFIGMAAQADNSIVAVVSDNNSIGADTQNARQLGATTQDLSHPRMEDVVVLVE